MSNNRLGSISKEFIRNERITELDIFWLFEEIRELREENKRLIKTLNYYADESIYDAQHKLDIMRDTGKYARKTLKEIADEV